MMEKIHFDNYLRNLSKNVSENIFNLNWGCFIMRNCDNEGDLLKFKTLDEYKKSGKQQWILCTVGLFRSNDERFGMYICDCCESMKGMNMMKIDQHRQQVESKRCHHSLAVERLKGDCYMNWTIPTIDEDTEYFKFFQNEDLEGVKLDVGNLYLSIYQKNKSLSVLFTVTSRQKVPLCSKCSGSKCPCYLEFRKLNPEHMANNPNTDILENNGTVEHHSYFTDRLPLNEHFKMYGANRSLITYPPKRNEQRKHEWILRSTGDYTLPAVIVANTAGNTSVCSHGNLFSENSDALILLSDNIIIYGEYTEQTRELKLYGRRTSGNCRCILQPDCDQYLLWHVGQGKMICYLTLNGYLHKFRASGMPMNAFYNARSENMKSIGVITTLSHQEWERSCCGYFSHLDFEKQVWSCPNCGVTPKYIVCDGKDCGPAKRKVDSLKELSQHVDDKESLIQGSLFRNRLFLKDHKERQSVCALVSKSCSMENFLEDPLQSETGLLINTLVTRIDEEYAEIPDQYCRFINNCCKPTPVAGFLQPIKPDSINILHEFCEDLVDLHDAENQQHLKIVSEEFPPLWEMLDGILLLGKSLITLHN